MFDQDTRPEPTGRPVDGTEGLAIPHQGAAQLDRDHRTDPGKVKQVSYGDGVTRSQRVACSAEEPERCGADWCDGQFGQFYRVPDFREGKVSLATQNGIGRVEPIDDAQFERKVRMLFGYNGSRLLPGDIGGVGAHHDLQFADLKALCQGNVPGEFREVGKDRRAVLKHDLAETVGVTPTLSNSRTPSWSSMNFRLRVRAGCEIPSAAAARPKCRCSAKARTSSSCLAEYMITPSYPLMQH